MAERLQGRRALITGAAGGLGSAIASAFVREGALVAALGRNWAALDELCATLSPERALPVPADVGDPEATATAIHHAAGLLGGLDTVVNAAAVDCEWQPVGELSVESWDRTIATNLSGTFYVCRAALPWLVEAGGGSIVNVTSVAGLRAWALDSAYNASKAGVEMLTRTIAVEYGAQGVRANCLAPGVIDAGMTDDVDEPGGPRGARPPPPARTDGQRGGGRRGCGLALLFRVVHHRHDPRRRRRLPGARLVE